MIDELEAERGDPEGADAEDGPAEGPAWIRRLTRRLGLDERAHAGFMTGIVVTAGLLAAAGGAAVLLQGADDLKEKGAAASDEASDIGMDRLQVVEAYGVVRAGRVATLVEVVSPGPTSDSIDLREVLFTLRAEAALAPLPGAQGLARLSYGEEPSPENFTVRVIRDANGSVRAGEPVVDAKDLVEIVIDLEGAGMTLAPRDVLEQTLLFGSATKAFHTFEAPSTFGTGTLVHFLE